MDVQAERLADGERAIAEINPARRTSRAAEAKLAGAPR
jgi:hypothetical protein